MLKRAVESALARGLRPWLERRSRASVAVLAYHNVVPEGGEPGADASLHLSFGDFRRQLDALEETHRVVSLEEALQALEAASPQETPQPQAVITFDDAYRGAMTCGLEELDRRGLPATVFVSPGVLGTEGMWWDRVRLDGQHEEEAAGRVESANDPEAGEASSSREVLLTEEAGLTGEALRRAGEERWPVAEAPLHARPVSAEELRDAAGCAGVSFGAHGWSHANLAVLDRDELREELLRPLAWLRDRLGDAALPVLAYPYGRWTPEVEAAAREAGYRAAFRVSGGRLDPRSEPPYSLPRINVPAGVSVDGFRLRVHGLLA